MKGGNKRLNNKKLRVIFIFLILSTTAMIPPFISSLTLFRAGRPDGLPSPSRERGRCERVKFLFRFTKKVDTSCPLIFHRRKTPSTPPPPPRPYRGERGCSGGAGSPHPRSGGAAGPGRPRQPKTRRDSSQPGIPNHGRRVGESQLLRLNHAKALAKLKHSPGSV